MHPVLDDVLALWEVEGWTVLMGRTPQIEDLIIPSRRHRMRSPNQVLHAFHRDLARLGLRKRRVHDARRTFVSLCRAGGAQDDVLEGITHAPRGNILSLYTTLPWESYCEAILCLGLQVRS